MVFRIKILLNSTAFRYLLIYSVLIFVTGKVGFANMQEISKQPVKWAVTRHEGGRARILFAADPVLAKIADNPDFSPEWAEEVTADENGAVRHRLLRNGWAYTVYESDQEQTLLLEGNGFHSIFVNGERFMGDYYSKGYLRVAIPVKQGANRLIVRARRGGFTLNFIPANGSCSISPRDPLLPDMRAGILLDTFGAVVILNHTDKPLTDATLEVVSSPEVFQPVQVPLPPMLPYGLAKPAFPLKQMRHPAEGEMPDGKCKISITLHHEQTHDTIELFIPLRQADSPYKATKLSAIDGSVQYYAVRPPTKLEPTQEYALYLTLHGASVEATGQIGAYTAKRDGYLVAPTNRRPYGFDWQEWGRLDALETLDLFARNHKIDPTRIYLTGHSMGGHGVWYLGALYPGRFAAIAPSAGWASFFSYSRSLRKDEETESPPSAFELAQLESDTPSLLENFTNLPIYVLHGEKDDNVPVEESRRMAAKLEGFHQDFVYHEQLGAGHWWGSEEGGCVDGIPLFEFLRRHRNPMQPLAIRFQTPNPAISASYAWLTVQTQVEQSRLSSVDAKVDPRGRIVTISTDNVASLALALAEALPNGVATIRIDDTTLESASKEELTSVESAIYLARAENGAWDITAPPLPGIKGPHRGGLFKLAFDKQMVWVYGTGGSEEENAALIAKVRYDSQVWWYRGNGNVTIVPDSSFEPAAFANRNIILYGNADTNSAFGKLLENCPIQVNREGVSVGARNYQGDLGVLFIYPCLNTEENSIGVIGMTTLRAMRMNLQARYFISGVACPDYVVFGLETLSKGMEGVLEAGFFDNGWELSDD